MQGSITEAELHPASCQQKLKKNAEVPRNAAELIAALTQEDVPRLAALRSKIAKLSEMLQKSPDEVTIDDIHYAKPGLRPYLKGQRLAENSVQAYVSEVSCLLNHAVRLGWRPDVEVPAPWRSILERCIEAKCDAVCRYILRKRWTPNVVSREDLDEWTQMYVERGGAWSTARSKANKLWRILFESGAVERLPASLLDGFGVPLADFPPSLRAEVESILSWKTAAFAPGRKKRGKIRKESAGNLRRSFSELYGFATRVKGATAIHSVPELVTPEIVNQYVDWALNDRQVLGQSIHSRLVIILAVLSRHSRYKDFDTTWLKELTEAIPVESETERKEKQAAKQVPYGMVEVIPEKIHVERRRAAQSSSKDLAIVVRDQLLMLWLTVLPWRQRNLRECRVSGRRPNLFKAKLNPFLPIAKPAWVEEELRSNPDAEFWQFKFMPEETKVGNGVHALVPRPLIPLLEEYLTEQRNHLIGDGSDYLFPSEAGTMISRARMTIIVGELTLRHVGKRITPHTFRHILAYAWLDAHPKDFLTLSKILFHTNINTTLRCYGARFNESNGACGMEKWVESRKRAA
jgi:hypothetical protein